MFERALDIASARTGDLRRLAKIAGGNPSTFYRYADLSGADLRGQDLRGVDFTGAAIDDIEIDHRTRVDDRFAGGFVEAFERTLSAELEASPARAGRALFQLILVLQAFGMHDDAERYFEAMVSVGHRPPLQIYELHADGMPQVSLARFASAWVSQYRGHPDVEVALARILLAPGWRGSSLDFVRRYFNRQNRKPGGYVMGVSLAVQLVPYYRFLRSEFERFADAAGADEKALAVLVRLLVIEPQDQFMSAWGEAFFRSLSADNAASEALYVLLKVLGRTAPRRRSWDGALPYPANRNIPRSAADTVAAANRIQDYLLREHSMGRWLTLLPDLLRAFQLRAALLEQSRNSLLHDEGTHKIASDIRSWVQRTARTFELKVDNPTADEARKLITD